MLLGITREREASGGVGIVVVSWYAVETRGEGMMLMLRYIEKREKENGKNAFPAAAKQIHDALASPLLARRLHYDNDIAVTHTLIDLFI